MAATAVLLVDAVDAVVGQDLRALSFEQLQSLFADVAPQMQRLEAFTGAVLAELQTRGGGTVPTEDGRSRPLPGWAAETSGESTSMAARAIRTASALQEALPTIAQAVLDGTLPYARAEVLTRLVGLIERESLAEAEHHLLVTAQAMDPVQLSAYVRHLIATWVEPALDRDEEQAHNRRYLRTRRQQDGSLWGSFLLAGGDSESLLTALEPLARRQGLGDGRSAAQRRADALVDMCEQVLRHGKLPDAGGMRPQLTYVLPADWAARAAAADACGDCSRCPQHLPRSFDGLVAAGVPGGRRGTTAGVAGGGRDTASSLATRDHTAATPDAAPVPANHACAVAAWSGPQTRARIETMLCDARISRLLLDRVGQASGLESLTDDVTPAQRRALAARDLGCGVRGCTRPPAMCDAHHLVARADSGPTTLGNLVLLCRRHHVLWHLGKLSLRHLHVPWISAAHPVGPAPPTPVQPTRGRRQQVSASRALRAAGTSSAAARG